MSRFIAKSTLLAVLLASAAACGGGSGSAAQAVDLHGAGATFPQPLYDAWFKTYVGAHQAIRIDYQPVGSFLRIVIVRSSTAR